MLTGRIRYRIGWRGKLVLQVEHSTGVLAVDGPHTGKVCGPYFGWRDATIEDMQDPIIHQGEHGLRRL